MLAVAAATVAGCGPAYKWGLMDPHPAIQFDNQQTLRELSPLEPAALTVQPVTQLEGVPLEPAAEIVSRAKAVTASGDGDIPVVVLTLPEVRVNALKYNLNLQVDLHNPLLTEEAYQAELWKFESVFAASQSYNTSIDGRGSETDRASFSSSVRVPTRLGGTTTVSLPVTRSDFDATAVNPRTGMFGGRTDSKGFEIGINQPLWRNAGKYVNHASIDVAGLIMVQSNARARLSAVTVLANVEQAYWLHFAAHENLKIQLELYTIAQQQLQMSQRLVQEGVRTRVEITRAESGVAQRYEQVVSAELNRRIAERRLKRQMNHPDLSVESLTSIIPGTMPSPAGYKFDRGAVLELAMANRMELFENRIQQEIDQVNVNLSSNAIRPDIRFDFRYAFSGDGPNFDQALDRLWRPDLDSYTVAVTSEVPLQGNQAARARFRRSLLALSQSRAFWKSIAIGVSEEVGNSIDSIEQIWHRVLANRIAVDTARRTYEAERRQFEAGESTNTDVFVQLSNFAAAQQLLIQSLSDFQRAVVDLAFASGTVLGQGGVVWGQPNTIDDSWTDPGEWCPPISLPSAPWDATIEQLPATQPLNDPMEDEPALLPAFGEIRS